MDKVFDSIIILIHAVYSQQNFQNEMFTEQTEVFLQDRRDKLYAKNFVICDKEQLYSKNLVQIFAGKKESGFQMYLFHTLDELEEFARQKQIHILLIDEEYRKEERAQISAFRKFVLVKGTKDTLLEEETGVYRYQCAQDIWDQILYSEEGQRQEQTSPAAGIKKELIGVYSPVHRIGKTKFALEMGRKLAETVPVLYLNLEEYPGNEIYFSAQPEYTLGDLFYFLRQEKTNLGIRISMMAEQTGKLDYIAPMPYVQDLWAVSCEEWQKLFHQILEQCIYEKVILDMGDSINGLFCILQDCDVVYTPYIDEPAARAKLSQYAENLRRTGLESVLEKTVQKKMKIEGDAGFKPYVDERRTII